MDNISDTLSYDSEYQGTLSFSDIYSYIISGDMDGLFAYMGAYITDNLFSELKNNKAYIIQLMAVIILGSIFSGSFGKGNSMTESNIFFLTYIIIVSLLLGIFTLAHDVAVQAVTHMSELMLVFIPAYSMAVGYTQGGTTAEFVYEMIIFIIYLCENIICNVIFPLSKCVGIIGVVNKINSEDYFSKMVGLIRNIVSWIIKTMLAVVTGMNVIKGLITPAIDRINRQTVIKIMTSLPGGSTAQTVSDILLSSGILIKNAIGIAGAVVILFASVIPVIKIWCIYISLRLVSALVQPVGDKRYSEAINIMAQAVALILKGCGTAVLMFIISIMLMSMLTSLG
jgi:stage III sporulation protein AE